VHTGGNAKKLHWGAQFHNDVRCFSLKQVLARAWLEDWHLVHVAACSLAVVLGRVASVLEASNRCMQRTFW